MYLKLKLTCFLIQAGAEKPQIVRFFRTNAFHPYSFLQQELQYIFVFIQIKLFSADGIFIDCIIIEEWYKMHSQHKDSQTGLDIGIN